MNKENAHLFLPLVQALVDGKTIQWNSEYEGLECWDDLNEIEFLMHDDPSCFRIKPEPRTFEMWFYKPTGRMYPWLEDEKQYVESDEWERITVQEVLE
jgi:hypothetical protein